MSRSPGLYVHVPFCSAICPYCDFAVVTGAVRRSESYVSSLLREIEIRDIPRGADTLYLGGGTPSLLTGEQIGRLRDALPIADDVRMYLEANPEDVSRETVDAWRACGVTTLSLGIQAFDDEALRFLGRRHSAAEARRAVDVARDGGFETLSVDLIYGLPDSDSASWRKELSQAVALGPDHLSCYQLTVHGDTLFGRRRREGVLIEADPERQAELFRETHRFLADAGYEGYEVSSFARGKAHRSHHNEKYWDHTPYLGLGPSAHSFDGRRRSWNLRRLFGWRAAVQRGESPVEGCETVDDRALLLETLMLRLRTRDGLDLGELQTRFGFDLIGMNEELMARLSREGLVEIDEGRLLPTLEGLAVADGIVRALKLPESLVESCLR